MHVINSVDDLISLELEKNSSLGFVPTMGALHAGHLSLIRRAKEENDIVVCSIFVNPTQFNNASDLANYPRQLQSDIELLEKENCDFLFVPEASDIYSDRIQSGNYDFGRLEKVMEAEFRPGHFKGVATIVHRFFELIKPNKAYFGEKDFQQLQIIKQLVRNENLAIEIIECSTEREANGLAMSSRNERLSSKHRDKASVLYESLMFAKENYNSISLKSMLQTLNARINTVDGVKLEYLQFVDSESLEQLDNWEDANHVRACVAAFFGEVRLIDNLLLF